MIYKAIGFDWGGVLNGKPGSVFGENMAKLLEVTLEQYREAYFHHNMPFNRGEITVEELWKRVVTELHKTDKIDAAIKLAEESHRESLNEDVLELVDKLRATGYKVGLLSNNTKEKADEMRASGLASRFDVFHVSAETGLAKPEPEAFTYFAKALEVDPDQFIFIDDAEKSLSSAEQVGFTPILFTDYDQLVQDLLKLGIRI